MATSFTTGLFGSDYSFISTRQSEIHKLGRQLRRSGNRKLMELFDTLIGQAAGQTAAATHTRVAHVQHPYAPGAIETVTDINRVTTATDRADLREINNEDNRATRLVGQRRLLNQKG